MTCSLDYNARRANRRSPASLPICILCEVLFLWMPTQAPEPSDPFTDRHPRHSSHHVNPRAALRLATLLLAIAGLAWLLCALDAPLWVAPPAV